MHSSGLTLRRVITGRILWRSLSAVLTLVALGFVAWKIHEAGLGSPTVWTQPELWASIILGGLAYAVALSLVAAGWSVLVRSASPDGSLPVRSALSIYAISQLFKYLPTNTLHYVGRHAALRRLGIAHSAAALGGLGEIVLIVPASLLVTLIAGQTAFSRLDGRIGGLSLAVAALLVFGALALHLIIPRLARIPRTAALAQALGSRRLRVAAIVAFASYSLFFIVSGAIFAIVACQLGDWRAEDAMLLGTIWTGSWALGFVAPGAPAGIGVREAILIAGLAAAGHPADAAQIAIAMRLVTLLGDLGFAGIGILTGRDTRTVSPLPMAASPAN